MYVIFAQIIFLMFKEIVNVLLKNIKVFVTLFHLLGNNVIRKAIAHNKICEYEIRKNTWPESKTLE